MSFWAVDFQLVNSKRENARRSVSAIRPLVTCNAAEQAPHRAGLSLTASVSPMRNNREMKPTVR